MSAAVLRADARCLPLPDASVDLLVTSPPYFGLRSYTDGGEHYGGQIGSEATPREWLAAMLDCTREWVRVLKPSGSIFVNLGDKFGGGVWPSKNGSGASTLGHHKGGGGPHSDKLTSQGPPQVGLALGQPKSLLGLPWRYALACMDDLGLILRRDIIWSKPNGLPESVTDRCRSSHEYVFHLVKQPRYYAAVDEIREPHSGGSHAAGSGASRRFLDSHGLTSHRAMGTDPRDYNPLGKLPSSVWEIPSQPLTVPAHLGVDHFACVDTETEILTPRGWLRHDQLTEGDQVAGYDLGTDMARWTECSAVNRYDYDGEMIAVESRDLSMWLTPNHRTIVQRMDAYTKRRNPVSVVRADQLDRYHFIPRSAAWKPFGGDFYVGERPAAMMGWVAAEGWYQGSGVWLSQSLDVNAPHVAEIDRLIPTAARTERARTYKGRPWTEVTWKLGLMARLIQREMPDKLLPWWLVTATEPERRAVLGAFIDGDGHRRPDGRIGIFQKLRHNLDVLQAIAVTLGYKTTLRESDGRFVLYLTEGGRSITLRGTSAVGTPGAGSKVKREHYKGTVWCPATGTGTFIARRNGSVFVTGNSFPMELPRRIILGWSPPGICVACGEGRRPEVPRERYGTALRAAREAAGLSRQDVANTLGCHLRSLSDWEDEGHLPGVSAWDALSDLLGIGLSRAQFVATYDYLDTGSGDTDLRRRAQAAGAATYARKKNTIARQGTGYACACPDATAPTRPALVVDPFGGTGTTALVAAMYGRLGVSFDLSTDYCRLARWRTRDPAQRAAAMGVPKPPPVPDGQGDLFDMLEVAP